MAISADPACALKGDERRRDAARHPLVEARE
jgi:hypothetical protein